MVYYLHEKPGVVELVGMTKLIGVAKIFIATAQTSFLFPCGVGCS